MKNIPTAELFTDLQITLTEIVLIELLEDSILAPAGRLEGNKRILQVIKSLMKDRFSDKDILNFLKNGFPRQVRLTALRRR